MWFSGKIDDTYWDGIISGFPEPAYIYPNQTDCRKRNVLSLQKVIGTESSGNIRKLCKSSDMSIYVYFFTCFSGLLYAYTSNPNIQILAPRFDRWNKGGGIAQCVTVMPENTFKENLLNVASLISDAVAHQDIDTVSVQQLTASLPYGRCIIQASKAIHDYKETDELNEKVAAALQLILDWGNDLLLHCEMLYDAALYTPEMAQQMLEDLVAIAEWACCHVDMKMMDMPIMAEEEEIDADTSPVFYALLDEQLSIADYVKHHAAQNPDGIAIQAGSRSITYRQLDRWTDDLMVRLCISEIKRDYVVGIVVNTTDEVVMSALAVLKAGAMFSIIDREMEDILPRLANVGEMDMVIVADGKQCVDLPGIKKISLSGLDDPAQENVQRISADESGAGCRCYRIDQSDGKLAHNDIAHRLLLHQSLQFCSMLRLVPSDKVMIRWNPVSDMSASEMFGWLVAGARLVVPLPQEKMDGQMIFRSVEHSAPTVMVLTPVMLNLYLAQACVLNQGMQSSLRSIVIRGGGFRATYVNRFYKMLDSSSIRLYQLFGPEGLCIDLIYRECQVDLRNEGLYAGEPYIGVNVLNSWKQRCRKWIPGTAYVDNSPDDEQLETANIARWRDNNVLEFLMYGEEREAIVNDALSQLGDIDEAVVLSPGAQSALLIVYLSNHTIAMENKYDDLQRMLRTNKDLKLIQWKDAIPLTDAGKIDYAFIRCGIQKQLDENDIKNEVYRDVLTIVQDILNVNTISLDDDFFSLGGDSLKAILISSRLLKQNYTIDVNVMLANPIIRDICKSVQVNEVNSAVGEVIGEAALTPSQRHFFDHVKTDRNYYNQSVLLHNKDGYDERALREALLDILEHHDALRCVLDEKNGERRLIYRPYDESILDFSTIDLAGIEERTCQETILTENKRLQACLDLRRGSMMRCILYRGSNGDHLFITIHHLVIDGVSWRILFEDLESAYEQRSRGEKSKLPRKGTSFMQWSEALVKYADTENMASEMRHWDLIENIGKNLVFASVDTHANKLEDMHQVTVRFTEDQTEQLIKGVYNVGQTTPLTLFLSALAMAVYRCTGRDVFAIALEQHGRAPIEPDLDIARTVGWFGCVFPFDVHLAEGLEDTISNIGAVLSNIPQQGIGYGVAKYLLKDSDSRTRTLPQIFFNYLGEFFSKSQSSFFELSSYKTGTSISPRCEREYILDIKGEIIQGSMQFSFDYNQKQLVKYNIPELFHHFEKAVLEIIDHCNQAVRIGNHVLKQSELTNVLSHLDLLEE